MPKQRDNDQPFQLPKDAIKRAELGQSFAEYDLVRTERNLYVETPAIAAATDSESSKAIFVGRRGTGKTATALYLEQRNPKHALLILPEVFSVLGKYIVHKGLEDVQQRPFKTAVVCLKRALLDEVVARWVHNGVFQFRPSGAAEINRERGSIEQDDFDSRILKLVEEAFPLLDSGRDRDWLRFSKRSKALAEEVIEEAASDPRRNLLIVIDRIDEDWDGSEEAVSFLMALLHACIELNSISTNLKFLVFLRENMFDRVRQVDSEFSRLETAVVSLDWTKEQLREFIERRLQRKIIAKPALGGPTWRAFFEDGPNVQSEELVFGYCQFRPRDVLTYCNFALDNAKARLNKRITVEDVLAARSKFSQNRMKEIGDEYNENYPQLTLVLSSFYGLGKKYTYTAISDFMRKLVSSEDIKERCGKWIFNYMAPETFMSLLYGIGFAGIEGRDGTVRFKLHEAQPLNPTDVTRNSIMVIHETYADALQLQDKLVTGIGENLDLKMEGLIEELPEAFDAQDYRLQLEVLKNELEQIKLGKDDAARFEDFCGNLIKLCFYRWLGNVEPKVRTHDGRSIRDWMASNRAPSGLWEILRTKYNATQVIFECKNYSALSADDFHQAAYYMNDRGAGSVFFLHA